MVQRDVPTVAAYLESLPDDRRVALEGALKLVRRALPEGYREGIVYGMIGWAIPLERYPDTYNGQPLAIVCLAAQKNHNALYLHGPYADPALEGRLRRGYAEAGKKLDMGKSCLRFKRVEDLEPESLTEVIAALPPERFIELYEAAKSSTRSAAPGRR